MFEYLTPGQLVTSPQNPDWGVGQIQSVVENRITVNFEHVGKLVVNGDEVPLDLHFV